ncbi:MAG: chitobiase/beta-hexosaminidase C-terminal domain-containing protein [Bacteroidales bacterium]|jgi:hypothetical protein|nr:chitobiase/beta-hexosaminidase C-terminal domain-containing protein [Bacteroidales bacterium]
MRTNLFKKLTFALLAFLVAATVGSAYAKQYDLVTNTNQLVSGKKYVLVGQINNSSNWALKVSTTTDFYNGIYGIVIPGYGTSSSKQTPPSNISEDIAYGEITLETGTNEGDWKLGFQDQYLRGSTLNGMGINSTAANWTIFVATTGEATIKCNGTGSLYDKNYLQYVYTTTGTSFRCYSAAQGSVYLYVEHVDAPPPPTVVPTSGTNIKNFTMTEGETLAETITLKASNVTKDLNVSIIKGGENAAMTVTTNTTSNGTVSTSELTIGDDDTTFSVSIANNGALSAGTYHDTLVIEQDGIRAGEVVLNLTVSAANAPAISITKPTSSQIITADSLNTEYTLKNLNVNGTVRAQLSGAGRYDSVQIISGTGTANVWIRNLASGNYILEATLVETSNPSTVLATASSVDFSVDLPDIVEGTDYEVLVSGGTYREETKSYKDSVRVKIAALKNIEIAEVRYTTDGTTPNAASSLLAAEGVKFTAAGSHTLKYRVVIAHHDTLYGDTTVSVHYLYTDKVTANPAPGMYLSTQNVTLSCVTSGAVIRYTTDGSTPKETSDVYSTPIEISATTTLKALAWADGYHANNDSVVAVEYVIITEPTYVLVTSDDMLSAGEKYAILAKKAAAGPWYGLTSMKLASGNNLWGSVRAVFDGSAAVQKFTTEEIATSVSDDTNTINLVLEGTSGNWKFFSPLHSKYLKQHNCNENRLSLADDGSTWDISIGDTHKIIVNGCARGILQFVSGSLNGIFACYNSWQNNSTVRLYRLYTPLVCEAPTALTSSDVTSTEATIGWTSTADTVKYRYGTAKPLSGEWTKAETDKGSVTLTLLASGTKYYYEVQNYCSNGLTSEAVIDNFTTFEALIPVITLSAESVAFDTIVTRSQTKSITVTAANLGGNATVTLKDGYAGFAVSPATANDNSETRIDITYTATGTEEQIDTVVISGGGITKYVTLTGTPVYPSVSVNVSSLQFNAVLGTPAKEKIVISGTNLLGDITLAKSNTSYTLDKGTVSAADAMRAGGDTVTITYAADVAASDTVVITASYATTVEIPVSGTVRNRYAVGVTFKKRCCRK